MNRLLGALLILSAAGAVYALHVRQKRQMLRILQELSSALRWMAAEIRWRNMPLPEVIQSLVENPVIGEHFSQLLHGLKGDIPLQRIWDEVFRNLKPEAAADLVCKLQLSGDAQHVMESLRYGAEGLTELLEKLQQERVHNEKIYLAASLTAAGLLVILLI